MQWFSTLFQRCCQVDMAAQRRTTSNQRWNNVVYVNVEIYNVEQLWTTIVIFNLEFHNVDQCRNNVVNMTIWKRFKRAKKDLWKKKKKKRKRKLRLNTLNSNFRLTFQILVDFTSHFQRNLEKNICKVAKVLITFWKCCFTRTIFQPSHFVKYWLAYN